MTQRINIILSEDMHQAIKEKAKERGATMSGLVRVVLAEWLETQGEKGNWEVETPGGYRPGEDS